MNATRLTYNYKTNTLDSTEFRFVLSRIEYFQVLKWDTVYEDESEIIEYKQFYGDLWEDDIEIKLLLTMKNGEEVVIEFDPVIYERLKKYFE